MKAEFSGATNMKSRQSHLRSSLGATLLEYSLAAALIITAFGVIIPGLNDSIDDMNPESMSEVSTQAAKDCYNSASPDYFFN